MRVVVNAVACTEGGAFSILESFYRYVRECDKENEWIFLLGNDLLEDSPRLRTVVLPNVKNSWLRRLSFDLVSGRRFISSLNPDVLLSLQNTHTDGVLCPQVVYVHQPLPFQRTRAFSPWRSDERVLAIYQYAIGALIKRSIRRSQHVIVQTQWMRDAILEQVGIARNRVTCVLPDLDDLSAYATDGVFQAGEFFYPTSELLYKNNECIYAACRLLRQQGTSDFRVTMTTKAVNPDLNVNAIGRIPRYQVLHWLSRTTLIFPSFIETYGLPLAEARALGAVVLAADCPYAREVLQDYPNAYYFDPASPKQLAALISRVVDGSITRVPDGEGGQVPRRPGQTPAWDDVLEILEGCSRQDVRLR